MLRLNWTKLRFWTRKKSTGHRDRERHKFRPALTQLEDRCVLSGIVATGADAGGGPHVQVFDASTGALKFGFYAYDPNFHGGVNVAVGDVNNDGTLDIITAPASGGGPHVKVFSGKDGSLMQSFYAYDPNFSGGVFVAAGDVDQDGKADIITGAGPGGGPHVKVFSGVDDSVLRSFFAYTPGFTGGVRVASGDTNHDGKDDIITGAGPGGGPHVEVFSGKDNSILESYFAYSPDFHGGVNVGSGDINHDLFDDVITGADRGGGPHVRVISGKDGSEIASFLAYGTDTRHHDDPLDDDDASHVWDDGVRVSAADINNDGQDDVITAAPSGHVPRAKGFDDNGSELERFEPYEDSFRGGFHIAGHS